MTRTTQTLPIETRGTDIKNWPDSPRALAGRLRRAATFLRKVGMEIGFGREGRAPAKKSRESARRYRPHRLRPRRNPI
jgi:hypothetical protein